MIFYFTATGNSLYAADKLSSALNEMLVDITDAIRKNEFEYTLREDEKVGFIFPVYFYGVPTIVNEFMDKLTLNGYSKHYIFSVITCGGSIKGADKQFSRLLRNHGYALTVSFELPMTDNYILLYDLASPSKQKSQLMAADRQLKKIADVINHNMTGGYKSTALGALVTAALYPLYQKGRKTLKFHAENSCVGCGLCEKTCPCGAIKTTTKGTPEWIKKQCIHCLGCINRCPVTAIQYGNTTKKRRRYVNPILRQGE